MSLRAKRSNLTLAPLYAVYILANPWNSVFYTGVTNNLIKRTGQHKQKITEGFTKKYNITKLIYYELFEHIEEALQREKQIKAGSRAKKITLIKSINPEFKDLFDRLIE